MSDETCIFCRIVAGHMPCHRVYEDEHTLVFMDIFPVADGHAL
ncbi:MAG: HIT domain-containing protein, partial [Planctomycetota bacterium]